MEHNSNTLPLEGVTVVDFSQYLAGPFCSLTLGELGAEIIKVESPKGDPARQFGPPFVKDESIYFMSVNRNKKSICLNLKNASGLRLAKELCEKADILIENFRPGIMEKFGLSYDNLSPNNSELIYCSISGYGQNSGYYRTSEGRSYASWFINIRYAIRDLGDKGYFGGFIQITKDRLRILSRYCNDGFHGNSFSLSNHL
jgi:crotonobetainyl-CoA:carnitine CoA-transferase CaiB-like acyl-CoA transferase